MLAYTRFLSVFLPSATVAVSAPAFPPFLVALAVILGACALGLYLVSLTHSVPAWEVPYAGPVAHQPAVAIVPVPVALHNVEVPTAVLFTSEGPTVVEAPRGWDVAPTSVPA